MAHEAGESFGQRQYGTGVSTSINLLVLYTSEKEACLFVLDFYSRHQASAASASSPCTAHLIVESSTFSRFRF